MKEPSRFYSSLGLLIILNVIIKPIWIFGIDRQVQNAVGTEVYGTYFSLFNLSIVFSFLLDWGLTTFFNRQLAVQKENFIERAGNFLLVKLFFSAIYAAVVCIVAWFCNIKEWHILLCVITVQVLTSLFVFLRSIITAQQWFKTDAWLSVSDKTLMILLCGSFLYLPSSFSTITIQSFLIAQIACTFLALVCGLVILFKRGVSFHVKSDSILSKQFFKQVLPFGLIVLLMSIHYRLDGFLLERVHKNGAYEAGLYAGAYRLLDAANMIGYLLASFLLPYIARQQIQGRDISGVILNSRHLLIIFSVSVASTTFFLAPWIQQMLYHTTNDAAINILQWCLPVLISYSLVQVYGTVMTATGHIVPFCYITLVAVIINVILNLLLIPGLGGKGCCIAALVSQGFCGLAAMFYVRKKSGINIHFPSLFMYIFIGAALCGYFYLCRNVILNRWLLIAVAAIIIIVMLLILNLFNIRKLKDIIRPVTF